MFYMRIMPKVKKHPLATNEASDRKRSPLGIAATGKIVFAGPGQEAIALGTSLVGWCSHEASPGQQRWGYSDQNSE